MTENSGIDERTDQSVQQAQADLVNDPEADAAAEDLELSEGVKQSYDEALERGAHQEGEGRFP